MVYLVQHAPDIALIAYPVLLVALALMHVNLHHQRKALEREVERLRKLCRDYSNKDGTT